MVKTDAKVKTKECNPKGRKEHVSRELVEKEESLYRTSMEIKNRKVSIRAIRKEKTLGAVEEARSVGERANEWPGKLGMDRLRAQIYVDRAES